MLGSKTFIIISSDQAVKDLLEKRSRIYSSRPELYLAWTVLGSGLRMASMVRNTTSFQVKIKTDASRARSTATHGAHPAA